MEEDQEDRGECDCERDFHHLANGWHSEMLRCNKKVLTVEFPTL